MYTVSPGFRDPYKPRLLIRVMINCSRHKSNQNIHISSSSSLITAKQPASGTFSWWTTGPACLSTFIVLAHQSVEF